MFANFSKELINYYHVFLQSFFTFQISFPYQVAQKTNAYLLADMAHISGLVAAGVRCFKSVIQNYEP